MSLHEYFNFMIGFMLPISVMMAVCFFVVIPLFGPSHKRETFSKVIEVCSSTFFSSKNSSHVTDFMENCGNMLRYVNVDAQKNFLTGCIKKITTTGNPEALANSILICKRKLQSEGKGSNFGLLTSVVVMSIVMSHVVTYFKNNPPFPEHNLSFWDELKRFMHRLQGTRNTPILLPANDLLTRCSDLIVRLLGLDDSAAHQKSEMLTHLLEQVKADLPHTPTDTEIAQQLLEKRDIIQHGMSFFTIAAQRRCSDTFNFLPGDNKAHSYKTSSIKHLTAPPHTRLFELHALQEDKKETAEERKLNKIV